jgi:type IV pilus assembly protein PilM
MLNTKSFLTVDFGAGSLKLAEFEITEGGGLSLNKFVIKPLGLEGSQESTREKAISQALQSALTEQDIKAKSVNVCAPGFHVFSKFVKLPPVDAAKVGQIIQYEAQQNVPFPLAEVVWDYQILGSAASGELEVLLVAIKSEIVEGLFRVADEAKLNLSLCDASPAALCNAFRYNYGELDDCTMLLDIGAKTSNLLFFEKGKVFSRSINLGANTITQDFAAEARLKFGEAEKIKIAEGFVSLGGAYEEPENPHQAAISKIARQFMTKLHIQVNQTMQFYRGQQGGSAPQRLYLSGGASIMPYTAQFFAEKLNVPVEYFNPFRNVQINPAVNLEELSRVAHSMGEVVGLALRNLATCPVEMNLMPESTLRWQSFNQKKPYLIATVFSLVLVAFAMGFLFQKLSNNKQAEIDRLTPTLEQSRNESRRFDSAYGKLTKSLEEANHITGLMQERYYWGDFISEVRMSLMRAETTLQKKLSAQRAGVDVGIWVEQMIADPTLGMSAGAMGMGMGMPPGAMPGAAPGVNPALAAYGNAANPELDMPGGAPMANPNAMNPGMVDPNAPPAAAATNFVTLVCRAVNLSELDPSANSEMAYAVENELKNSALVDPKQTQLTGQITTDDTTGTFTFMVNVVPKSPAKN